MYLPFSMYLGAVKVDQIATHSHERFLGYRTKSRRPPAGPVTSATELLATERQL